MPAPYPAGAISLSRAALAVCSVAVVAAAVLVSLKIVDVVYDSSWWVAERLDPLPPGAELEDALTDSLFTFYYLLSPLYAVALGITRFQLRRLVDQPAVGASLGTFLTLVVPFVGTLLAIPLWERLEGEVQQATGAPTGPSWFGQALAIPVLLCVLCTGAIFAANLLPVSSGRAVLALGLILGTAGPLALRANLFRLARRALARGQQEPDVGRAAAERSSAAA